MKIDRRTSSIPYYFISGNIVEIINENDIEYAIIDSGIYINFETPNNLELHMGDYVEVEGQLNVKKSYKHIIPVSLITTFSPTRTTIPKKVDEKR